MVLSCAWAEIFRDCTPGKQDPGDADRCIRRQPVIDSQLFYSFLLCLFFRFRPTIPFGITRGADRFSHSYPNDYFTIDNQMPRITRFINRPKNDSSARKKVDQLC